MKPVRRERATHVQHAAAPTQGTQGRPPSTREVRGSSAADLQGSTTVVAGAAWLCSLPVQQSPESDRAMPPIFDCSEGHRGSYSQTRKLTKESETDARIRSSWFIKRVMRAPVSDHHGSATP